MYSKYSKINRSKRNKGHEGKTRMFQQRLFTIVMYRKNDNSVNVISE